MLTGSESASGLLLNKSTGHVYLYRPFRTNIYGMYILNILKWISWIQIYNNFKQTINYSVVTTKSPMLFHYWTPMLF